MINIKMLLRTYSFLWFLKNGIQNGTLVVICDNFKLLHLNFVQICVSILAVATILVHFKSKKQV